MLVLSRKVGERIEMDGEIEVTVLRVEGNKVRLGIKAPPAINVWRSEIAPLEPDREPAGV